MVTNAEIDRRLVKDQKTGIYQVKIKGKQGTRLRSTKATRLEEAREMVREAKLIELELASKAGALTAEAISAIVVGKKVTCSSAIPAWEKWMMSSSSPGTVRSMKLIINQWLKLLGAERWPIQKLSIEHVDGFVNADDDTKLSNRNFRLTAIRSFFKYCNAIGVFIGNPAMAVRVRLNNLSHEQKEPKKRVPITLHEYRHIMKHATGFLRYATAIGYWTGLRLVDIACLEWSSILTNEIVIWTRKREKRIALPLNDPLIGSGELKNILFEMMMESDPAASPYCFPEERTIALDPEKRSRHSVYYGRLLESLGIHGKSFHCLRHAFQTRLERAGKPVEEIGRLVGHSDTATTEGYIHRHAKI